MSKAGAGQPAVVHLIPGVAGGWVLGRTPRRAAPLSSRGDRASRSRRGCAPRLWRRGTR